MDRAEAWQQPGTASPHLLSKPLRKQQECLHSSTICTFSKIQRQIKPIHTKQHTVDRLRDHLSVRWWRTDTEKVVHIHKGTILGTNKECGLTVCDNGDEPSGHYAKWNNSEKRQYHMTRLCVKSKKTKKTPNKLRDTENSLVVARGDGWGGRCQKVHVSSYSTGKSWEFKGCGDYGSRCCSAYGKVAERVNPQVLVTPTARFCSCVRGQMLTRLIFQYIQISNHCVVYLKLIKWL